MREIVLDEIQAVLLRDDDWRLVGSLEIHEGVEFADKPEAPLYRADEGLWVEIAQGGFDDEHSDEYSRVVAPLSSIVALRLHPGAWVISKRFPGA